VKEDGSYTISALATGRYALHLLFREAGRSHVRTFVSREVDVAEGASTVADFDQGSGVTVHLTELRGPAQVMILPGARPLPADAEAFGQLARRGVGMGGTMGGSLELGPLPPGDYTIVLLRQGEGLRLQTSSLVIHVGEADLSVSAASAVEGPLYDISRLERE
jgi:hypothetical protein